MAIRQTDCCGCCVMILILVEQMTQTGVEAVTTAATNTYGLPLGCRDIKGFAENLQNGDLSPRVRQAAAKVSSLFEGGWFHYRVTGAGRTISALWLVDQSARPARL